jgi:hypothetical protein
MMSETPNTWKPSPELLAAFVDGELYGAEASRVEAYLTAHPEAQAEVTEQRRLARLWQRTTPAEPGRAAWQRTLDRILAGPRRTRPRSRRWSYFLAATVAAAAVGVILWTGMSRPRTPVPIESLPVAQSSDVEITRIDGDDVGLVAVGRLPLVGVLELANAGEIEITGMPQPNPRMPMVQVAGGSPMIWAKLESEP